MYITLLSMVTFSFVMSISPGPVNIMIISSGATYGFKKTFSFVSGATIGFTLLLAFISFGFHKIFDEIFLNYLGIFGSLFIIYMGYKIINSTSKMSLENSNKDLKFHEGFLLQWLNPKAWIASISGVTMFTASDINLNIFVLIYFVVCYLSLSFWALVGLKATTFLNTNKRLKIFNLLMGILLILIAVFLIFLNIKEF